jgi:hypothetical protein
MSESSRRGFFAAPGGAPSASIRSVALGTILAVAATSQGCGCGDEDPPRCGESCGEQCLPGLDLGMPGSYTSLAKAKDGTIWVAGYNDALLSEGDSFLWGDLVVGRYNASRQAVEWSTVDGIPTREAGCVDHDPRGFRRGETNSGDNVGLWTSMQVSAEGTPLVSYYDATNRRLKFAIQDRAWTTFVLREVPNGDAGRYGKMILVDGKPVIAFLQIEPGVSGKQRSKIVLARARTGRPHKAADFDFQDIAVDEDGPCRVDSCGGGEACVRSTGICTVTVAGCAPACAVPTEACVNVDGKATCVPVRGNVDVYPRAIGVYLSLAKGPAGLGVAAYDSNRGNLVAYAEIGSAWQVTILDGEVGDRAAKTALDTGDVGIATSLAIDEAGAWHVTYVNGLDETLRYLKYANGQVGPSHVVDDGTTVDGDLFVDGKHLVGDDSTIRVVDGEVLVYYQDATAGTLRRAAGTTTGEEITWNLRTVPQPNRFAGFFPQMVPGDDRVANWWRETNRTERTVVGNVSILKP